MTNEPVAYKAFNDDGSWNLRYTPSPFTLENIPLYTKDQLQPKVQMTQAEFDELEKSLINAQFDYSELKETIEIVPDMKWFVRVDSQIPLPDENIYLDNELIVYPHYDSPKSSAHQFDTKEEAEKWTNPLTEAVLLPVDE